MKTNIKMKCNDNQFRKVMNILKIDYKKQYHYENMYIIINNDLNVDFGYGGTFYKDSIREEIDADLFIRTNGTCEEINFQKTQDAFNDLAIQILEQKLKKKNEILKKARIKRKNQREELHKLNLKLQKCISLEEHHLKIKTVLNEKHKLEVENKTLKESSKISCNMLHSQKDKIDRLELNYVVEQSNYKKEIEKLKAVIEYLESKVK